MKRTERKLIGVVGWPISHSYSPIMQTAALGVLGLSEGLGYEAFAVKPENLGLAIAGAAALGFLGLNVTLPHKEAAFSLCEVVDPLAERVGAINTLIFGESLQGFNTDVAGFVGLLGTTSPGQRALVIGAGGASRAVVVALRDLGIDVVVALRRPRLVVVDKTPLAVVPFTREALMPLLPTVDLLIDCSPRGLLQQGENSQGDFLLENLHLLAPTAQVIDLVVLPQTPLIQAAQGRGLAARTGATMLVLQGLLSLELWLAAHRIRRLSQADKGLAQAAMEGALANALGAPHTDGIIRS